MIEPTVQTESKPIAPPRSVSISVTGKCNLKCRYCFYSDKMGELQDLPKITWLNLFSLLSSIGVFETTLSGGEPFSRPDLFELIDGIVANHMRYSILSNGTLINEAVLARFKTGKRRLRMNSIQVSIDGSTAAIHNKSRPDSFEQALYGLRLLQKEQFPVTARVTFNRNNLNDIENIAHLLLEEIGLKSFSTNEAAPIGSRCRGDSDMLLLPQEMLQAMMTLEKLNKRFPGRIKADAGPQAKLRMYTEMIEARRTGKKTSRWHMGFLSGCGCVYNRIDILHDGTIVPCCMMPELALGNIQSDDLLEIWRKSPLLSSLRARRFIPMSAVPGCQRCEWNAYCNGSCPAIAYQTMGDFNQANPQDCLRSFLRKCGSQDVL